MSKARPFCTTTINNKRQNPGEAPLPEVELQPADSSAPSSFSSVPLLSHDLDKLLVIELPVAVEVGLRHELLKLLLGERLPERRRHSNDLLGIDVAVVVLVEDPKCLS